MEDLIRNREWSLAACVGEDDDNQFRKAAGRRKKEEGVCLFTRVMKSTSIAAPAPAAAGNKQRASPIRGQTFI